MKRSEGSVPAPLVPSRLVADDQQTFANVSLPLAVAVEHGKGNEYLVLDGLAVGPRLSAGEPIGASGWHLAANQLAAGILTRRATLSAMNTALDLLAPDQRPLDSRAVRLKWSLRIRRHSGPQPGQ